MIGFLPTPYPDELLYSIFARYSDIMQYRGKEKVQQDLFGYYKASGSIGLPDRLNNFINNLPSGNQYTLDRIINELTLMPFYRPFFPSSRVKYIQEYMYGITNRLNCNLDKRNTNLPLCMRFCQRCIDSDRTLYGECYWHRIHQIPGVEVCPIHETLIIQSNVQIRGREKRFQDFVSAESAVSDKILSSNPSHFDKVLLYIARDIDWLLNAYWINSDLEFLRRKIHMVLSYKGYVKNTRDIYLQTLKKAIDLHYSNQLPIQLQRLINNQNTHHWLDTIFPYKSGVIANPLCYLLLIHFLGYTAEEFFRLPSHNPPFGQGPWPCLNIASDHYGAPIITECHEKVNHNYSYRPLGLFACTCGFIYRRIGPDRYPDDRWHFSSVKAFGHVWESVLQALWLDPSIPIREFMPRLGVGYSTIKRKAKQLGLPFPLPGGITRYRPPRKK